MSGDYELDLGHFAGQPLRLGGLHVASILLLPPRRGQVDQVEERARLSRMRKGHAHRVLALRKIVAAVMKKK